jgi:hypothetical protein
VITISETSDVADTARIGKAGHRLKQDAGGSWLCPETGSRYEEIDGQLLPAKKG